MSNRDSPPGKNQFVGAVFTFSVQFHLTIHWVICFLSGTRSGRSRSAHSLTLRTCTVALRLESVGWLSRLRMISFTATDSNTIRLPSAACNTQHNKIVDSAFNCPGLGHHIQEDLCSTHPGTHTMQIQSRFLENGRSLVSVLNVGLQN